jgi:bacterioferritin-associated ferredoxin
LIVCHCAHVSERSINKALLRGATTVAAVAQETGTGRGCGCCVSTLKRLIEEHLGPSPLKEPSDAAA